MANNITPKLKAYVQIDATGRVVSGTPVFRTSKPKNGNWREIPMYYRGDSSTTTTTTSNGGVTPTAWVGYQSPTNLWSACNNPATTWTLYTNVDVTPLPAGTALYTDAALTNLVYPNDTMFFSINGYAYEVINGYINPLGGGMLCQYITTTSTTTQGPSAYTVGVGPLGSSSEVCSNPSPWSSTQTLWALGSGYNTGRQLYYDSAFTTPFTGTGWYAVMQGFPSGTKYSVYFNNGVLTAGFPC